AAGAFTNPTAGTAKTAAVSALSLSGTDATNYTLTQPTTSANITAKGLTVTGTSANNKPYDGNTTATLNFGSAALVGVVSGDTVRSEERRVGDAFTSPTVGTAKSVA